MEVHALIPLFISTFGPPINSLIVCRMNKGKKEVLPLDRTLHQLKVENGSFLVFQYAQDYEMVFHPMNYWFLFLYFYFLISLLWMKINI
jgi:hypothetical protein